MIGRIRGILIEKQATDIVVDVQGVGYEIQAPMSTIYLLPALGKEVVLHTHLVVREDAHLLYGFLSLDERHMFRSLIKISGVGPKMALAILSGMAVEEFVRTVRSNDLAALVRMPGIGRKTAERLVVEMKDKLTDWSEIASSSASLATATPSGLSDRQMSQEAETALVALGYKPQEAARVIAQVLKLNSDLNRSEELIRLALRSMAQS
ncbi:MAG: Holliday junction branch migration protein RuvA [Gammaproteobacteria bacterium]|nr:Holliday junction branch migration protein RuvA [Gammaproteobacteria bacterium]MDO9317120.1 Holliday junction branch migration protein RuvA [Gammaproteobacteria bacterium]